jgi:hypothetical protein
VSNLKVDADDGRLRLRWRSSSHPQPRRAKAGTQALPQVETWVQWSDDDGATWRGLATGLLGHEADLDLAGLPARRVRIRVLVHDGFSTAASDGVPVEIPEQPPEVAILHPEDDAVLMAGGTTRVWASVTDSAGTPLGDAWCRWLLDGREVAQGTDDWIDAPAPGTHRLTLLVRAAGAEVERTVDFHCLPGPTDGRGLRSRE